MSCHTCGATPTLYAVASREWCKLHRDEAIKAAQSTANQTSHSQEQQDRDKAHRDWTQHRELVNRSKK